jgi:hypothetical protein
LLLHSFASFVGRVAVRPIVSVAAVLAPAASAVALFSAATATAVFFTAVLHTAAVAVTSS